MKTKTTLLFLSILLISTLKLSGQSYSTNDTDSQGIKPYTQNPWYWQYQGEPLVLIGGSDDDNLFQWTGKQLTDHLDLLISSGGNYLRNTMSDRDEGNVFAFKKINEDSYDLNQWNDEYWRRLVFFSTKPLREASLFN
tara:strand:+ start:486 stop:899 length:414 start_codon:yes stop_codon:yes gene_type:complete